jgi:hypothetical protein
LGPSTVVSAVLSLSAAADPLSATAGPLSAAAGPLSTTVGPLFAAAGPLSATAGPLSAAAGPLSAAAGPHLSAAAVLSAAAGPLLFGGVNLLAPSGRTMIVAAPLVPGDVLLAAKRTNWERRARVAAMHRTTFPAPFSSLPAAAVPRAPSAWEQEQTLFDAAERERFATLRRAPDSPADVREVPPIAGPHPTLTLWEGVSERPMKFHTDQGSAFTVLREAEVRSMGLVLEAVTAESGLPSTLMQADGQGAGLQVVGMVQLKLHVPNTDVWLKVTAVVVDMLFCAFLLGRNVMNAMDEAYGRSSVWDEGGRAMPAAQAALASLKTMGATAKVTSVGRVMAPACEFEAGEASLRVLGEMWLPESLLSSVEGRVAKAQGFFLGSSASKRDAAILLGATIATAEVDWSPSGLVGSMRRATVVVDAVAGVARGHRPQLLHRHEVLGEFLLGRPVIAATAPPPTPAGLLQSVLERTFAESPFLADVSEQAKARAAISGFMFAEDLPKAAASKMLPFRIEMEPGTRPSARRNYSMSHTEELFAEEQIALWLKNGTIEPSLSAWSSPIVIAYHPRTGKARFCIDFRALNNATLGDAYLMPLITDISRAVLGCRIMSKVDLCQGFGQAEVDPASRPYTAFPGPRGGLYQFRGSPFGLKNLPAHFQRMMDRVLGGMAWQCACIYIDDCIVFSATLDEHHRHLTELAARFKAFNVYVRASKCEFYVAEVEFLGYIFDGATMRVIPERVASVLKCPVPANREELRSFMGLAGQFRHLIDKYGEIADPLEGMKQKDSLIPFDLSVGSAAFKAFVDLRAALVQMPKLVIPDMRLPFHGYADASKLAMSFVLCQTQNNVEHVVGFYSKTFKGAQLNWAIPTKEAYAVRHFVMGPAWKYFASGGPHKIFVDSVTSRALTEPTLKDLKLVRGAMDLVGMPLELVHIRGTDNKSDALTRPPIVPADPALANLLQDNPLRTHPGWQAAVAADDAWRKEHASTVVAPLLAPGISIRTATEMVEAQQADLEVCSWASFVSAGRPAAEAGDSFASASKSVSLASRGLVIGADGILLRAKATSRKLRIQVVVPKLLQAEFLEEAHSNSRRGLQGCKDALAMFEELRDSVWWPEMRSQCLEFSCAVCARQKKDHSRPAGLLHSTIASRPGQVLSMDVVPMSKARGFHGFVIVVDKFSGTVSSANVRATSGPIAVEAFDVCRSSLFVDVDTLIVDRDSVLTGDVFSDAMRKRGIEVVQAFAGHQQANFAERSVQHLKQVIRTTLDGLPTDAWVTVVPDVVRYLNTAYQSSKGASPYEIMTGWCPKGVLPYATSADVALQGHVFASRQQLWTKVSKSMEAANMSQAAAYNMRHEDRRFVAGDVVLVAAQRQQSEDGNFNLSPPYNPNPWIVEAVLSEVSLYLQSSEKKGVFRDVHVSDVRMAVTDVDLRKLQAESAGEYVVQKIHAHRKVRASEDMEFLVQWGGWKNMRDYTWEPRLHLLPNAAKILMRYEASAEIIK